MTEDKKPDVNGPPPNRPGPPNRPDAGGPVPGQGRGGGRGGRFSRFRPHGPHGPHHPNNQERGDVNPLLGNIKQEDVEMNDNHVEHPPHSNRGGRRGGRGGGGNRGGGHNPMKDDRNQRSDAMRNHDRINDKLSSMGGPTFDLPPRDNAEKKFSSRSRLYVGNLSDVTEEEVTEIFKKYGEVNECFVNREKMFAFVRLDYRANAERAKRELDGTLRKNKPMRVRFAPIGAAIKVKNLTQWVTNELLEYAFSIFGEIEHAQVLVDDRGNSLKEGVVEFARKPIALQALRRCTEGCFFLTSCLRPVIVEPFDVVDDIDGFAEKSITRKPDAYLKAREVGPRFASPGSFEFEYGVRWKQLHESYKQKEDVLKREMKAEEEKLEAQMEFAKYEHETEILREKLRIREQDRERHKIEWEMKERQAEEQQRRMNEGMMRRHVDDVPLRMHHPEEDMRRPMPPGRMDGPPGNPPMGDGMPPSGDQKMFMERNRFEGGGRHEDLPPPHQRVRWGPPGLSHPDEFPNKRPRRF